MICAPRDFVHRCAPLAGFLDRVRAKQPTVLLALGDSNTSNTGFTAGAKQWPELLHSRLKEMCASQTLLLVNAGISGDAVTEVEARYATDVHRFRPELVVLCLGTNDANRLSDVAYRDGMSRLLDRLTSDGAQVLLRTPTPIWERSPSRIWPEDDKLRAKVEIIQDLAEEWAVPFVDTYAWWRNLEARGELVMERMMCDEVHANAFGHALIEAQVATAFDL